MRSEIIKGNVPVSMEIRRLATKIRILQGGWTAKIGLIQRFDYLKTMHCAWEDGDGPSDAALETKIAWYSFSVFGLRRSRHQRRNSRRVRTRSRIRAKQQHSRKCLVSNISGATDESLARNRLIVERLADCRRCWMGTSIPRSCSSFMVNGWSISAGLLAPVTKRN